MGLAWMASMPTTAAGKPRQFATGGAFSFRLRGTSPMATRSTKERWLFAGLLIGYALVMGALVGGSYCLLDVK